MRGKSSEHGSRWNNEDGKHNKCDRERQTRLANSTTAMKGTAVFNGWFSKPKVVERLPAVWRNPLDGGERVI